ncbi:MAG: DUF4026 domain-containing protein [Proteobacteria bacterium]|nr:DUF4026 domain-containing protein [Pseudomonadota bacterium]
MDDHSSLLIGVLAAGAPLPSEADAIARLSESLATVTEIESFPVEDGGTWAVDAQVRIEEDEDEFAPLICSLGPRPDLDAIHVQGSRLLEDDVARAREASVAIAVECDMSDVSDPLRALHRQVQVLHALAPEAVVILDVAACAFRSGHWMWEVASCPIPPAPDALYTIHAIYDPDRPNAGAWLHTHGLRRCGLPEIEALDVPRDEAGSMGTLLNHVAPLLLERGVPEPEEPFEIGHEMSVLWLPWEEGLDHLPNSVEGGRGDREDLHGLPTCMLFHPDQQGMFWKRRYRRPSTIIERMSEHPVFWVTNAETARMGALARHRWPRYEKLLQRFGDSEDWRFVAKLGFLCADPEDSQDREHIWFHVHGSDGETLEGTLLNQPYRLPGMTQGDRGRHSIELLSDWTIYSEHGAVGPDVIVRLERMLDGAS